MKNYKSIVFSTFIISPLLALPIVLRGIYRRKEGSFFFLALLFGLFAFLTAPCGDLARHTRDYFILENMSWQTFFFYLKRDFIVQILSFLFGKMGIHYDYLRLFLTIIESLLLTKIFNYQINHSPRVYTDKEVWIRFLILFFTFDFFTTVLGVRFGFSLVLLVYSIHLWLNCNKAVWAVAFLLFAGFTHFSMFYFMTFVILISCLKLSRKTVLILIPVLLVASQFLTGVLAEYLEETDSYGSGYLSDGVWGTGAVYSFNGLIFRYIIEIVCLPLVFLVLKYFKECSKWSRFLSSFILLYAIVSSFATVSGRVIWIFFTMTAYFLIYIESRGVVLSKKAVNIVFYFCLLFFLSNLYGKRGVIEVSRYYKIVFSTPFSLDNYYDKQWVYKRMSDEKLL